MSRLRAVDHVETYGRHIIREWSKSIGGLSQVLDLGCGNGDDLRLVREVHPRAMCWGVDFKFDSKESRTADGINVLRLDIESEPLPFGDGEIDLVIANQVMEHTKEVFWINHQVARVLSLGGYYILGVPNALSLHNRILRLFGVHPTSCKMCSAHVRPFSKGDVLLFFSECFPDGYEPVSFCGSQFYPFPRNVARLLSTALPSLSFSIYFLFRKKREYSDGFIEYPRIASLETNYFGVK